MLETQGMETVQAIQHINIIRHILSDDGTFPNNGLLPLLVYQQVLPIGDDDPKNKIKALFESNGWANAWVDGVHDFHHYHAITHEVLGVTKGSARIQFGGPSGTAFLVERGDVIIIPAGVAHKAIDVYDDFTCIGAYPDGRDYDMNYGKEEERERAIENINALSIPAADPVYGLDGPLQTNWNHSG